MNLSNCLECGSSLSSKAKSCSCGWRKSEKSPLEVADHRCSYRAFSRRCPLPGGMCPYPYGAGIWYCSGHWRCLSDPQLGEAVFIDAEKNYQKILDTYRDWRKDLFK